MTAIECTESSACARTKPARLSNQIAGGLVLAGLSASALAAALGTAPQASASCASFFGVGNSSDCVSTATSIAIALGPGARAYALGSLGSAVAVGALSYASTDANTVLGTASALGNGAGAYVANGARMTSAFAVGTHAAAVINGGLLNQAVALGDNTLGYVNTSGSGGLVGGNLAVVIGNSRHLAQATADGSGNVAVSIFSPSSAKDFGSNVVASGTFNVAASLLSRDSQVFAGYGAKVLAGTRNAAFSIFGQGNDIAAQGPGTILVSVLEHAATTIRQGPGLTINGVNLLGRPPVQQSGTTSPAATTKTGARERRTPATGKPATTHGAKSGRRATPRSR
ncbi:hypothetical protein [Mycolicibacterium vinylchloridicum]|uniref:hypothetical protein n=1 Tax=Mycolicibacterium vinylchloridicum TaxID=2736928 RepID=UPI0015CA5710|nr:hypothetical protein [Mycolicibacterium vinylchloridicum]